MAEEAQAQPQPQHPAQPGRPAVRNRAPATAGGGPPTLRIFKPGQGVYVRWLTAAGGGVLALSAAHFVWTRIRMFAFIEGNDYVQTLLPVVVLLAAAWLIFWLVGRKPNVVDFLIATEGEMKKVNWSTRREVWGATRVVIVTVLAWACILFVVDILFIFFFGGIGVLKFDVMQQLFGKGP